MSLKDKRAAIDPSHPEIAIARQCVLLELPRSSFYYRADRDPIAATYDDTLMRLLDEQFTEVPVYGVRRMTAWLQRKGHDVNPKRIRRLMRAMGLEPIYPKPRLSLRDKQNPVYPYLLRDISIDRVNQVWGVDITYLRLRKGFAYLVAIMDWYSRYVLSWGLSLTLEADFCVLALREALLRATPEIFNSDQGSQFTSDAFTAHLLAAGVRISMDGRGRAFDNIFTERLWRTVKYEEVFLKDYENVPVARDSLGRFFRFYNEERLHQSLGYVPPSEVYFARALSPTG